MTHPFEVWHEFYLLAGTAAVTLVGLLFVSLSFNLETLIHESKAHILAHARSTLLCFSYVLVVSLGILVPYQTAHRVGIMIGAASAIVGTINVLSSRRRSGSEPPAFERKMRRRSRLYTAAYAIATFNGIAMLVTGAPELLFNMIGVICLMLGNAMGTSWDLLVEVGKLKAEKARAE